MNNGFIDNIIGYLNKFKDLEQKLFHVLDKHSFLLGVEYLLENEHFEHINQYKKIFITRGLDTNLNINDYFFNIKTFIDELKEADIPYQVFIPIIDRMVNKVGTMVLSIIEEKEEGFTKDNIEKFTNFVQTKMNSIQFA